MLDIKVLGWLPKVKYFGCPWHKFRCPDIIQMAEIPLVFLCWFFPMKNQLELHGKNLGLVVFCADQFHFTHWFVNLWNKKPLLTENDSHGIKSATQWNWISYTVSECRVSWTWFGVWKPLMVKIYHFRRNCTVPLDHLCEITKKRGSKHDTKLPILPGPSASENFCYFVAGFSIRMGVDSKP